MAVLPQLFHTFAVIPLEGSADLAEIEKLILKSSGTSVSAQEGPGSCLLEIGL